MALGARGSSNARPTPGDVHLVFGERERDLLDQMRHRVERAHLQFSVGLQGYLAHKQLPLS